MRSRLPMVQMIDGDDTRGWLIVKWRESSPTLTEVDEKQHESKEESKYSCSQRHDKS